MLHLHQNKAEQPAMRALEKEQQQAWIWGLGPAAISRDVDSLLVGVKFYFYYTFKE